MISNIRAQSCRSRRSAGSGRACAIRQSGKAWVLGSATAPAYESPPGVGPGRRRHGAGNAVAGVPWARVPGLVASSSVSQAPAPQSLDVESTKLSKLWVPSGSVQVPVLKAEGDQRVCEPRNATGAVLFGRFLCFP